MGPAGFHDCPWTAILLSASLLTTWNPLAAAQFTDHAELLSNTQMERASLAKPILTVRQRVVTEQRDMADFYCATNAVNATIHWVFNNSLLVLNERMKLSADNKNLTVLVVQREDSGSYLCEVQSGFEVGRSDDTLLEVNYGPDPVSIKLDSGVATGDVVEVMEGNTVNFWVETQSYPAPTYTWYLPTDSIQPPPITGQLTIPAISREQEGMYRCLVSNTVTNSSRLGVVKVQVLEKVTAPYIESPTLALVENATSVMLTCKTSHQRVGVHWYLRGQPLMPSEHLTLSSQNRTLTIHGLQRDDSGPYECEVWNWGSQARSVPLELTINYGPDQVDITQGSASGVVNTIEATLNSSLTLHCWADSKPGARYHWTHEHSSQVFAGDQLNIEALRQEHQGIYSCTSSNNVTGLTRSASVLVTVVGLQSSSMSPGVIAGIVIGILAAIALVIGLGYFLYSTKDRWIHRRSANDTTTSNTEPPTSVTQSTPESTRPNKPKPVYDNMLKPKGEDRGKKMPSPPPVSPEHFYEKKPPSAAPEGPRKPLPRIPKQPLVPPVPNRNKESNYEALLNPNQSLYCKINPSV
ncbi:carcinoembryonic antigen-related cell adhesion molecule 20 precursor [Rattus norvegicus]|uniref:CEA cell adhesion molecule 20 n=1 Tax=Rattus norvegicus TaxID=10116 RepID=D4ADQ8_RAT|nr:carcinoembryonic antigen-related cell adhesion molecule 20 precursor [Rattus norvegicus]|eukprot:NP_001163795.1 carcinoembryonic antigen-related cell adhesion molecule 20 precursor [Rattus norvegicus]